jgi:hypothetical protein
LHADEKKADHYYDGEIKNVGSDNDSEASDIKGGKGFGPASMAGGVLPREAKPFSRYKALCIYSFPKGKLQRVLVYIADPACIAMGRARLFSTGRRLKKDDTR